MTNKYLNGRIILKHDTAANWASATDFVPYKGEIIIYDPDASTNFARMKVGDGTKKVSELPFLPVTKGAASTIMEANLTANKALVSDASGKVGVSNVTSTELGYLSGVTENVQEQLNSKAIASLLAMPGSLKWDGVIGNREYVSITQDDSAMYGFVHISDEYPYIFNSLTGEESDAKAMIKVSAPLYASMGLIIDEGIIVPMVKQADGSVMIFDKNDEMAGWIAVPTDNFVSADAIFPKKGLYALAYSVFPSGLDISLFYSGALYIPGYSFSDDSAAKYFEKTTTTTNFGDTLTWDGDTTGLVATNTVTEDNGAVIITSYKVSDYILTATDFTSGYTVSFEESGTIHSETRTAEEVQALFNDDGFADLGDAVIMVVPTNGYTYAGLTFPSAGTYFTTYMVNGTGMRGVSLTVPGYNFTETKTKEIIKTEHLPEALRFGDMATKSDTLTWDGNTDGLASAMNIHYKVSDCVPTLADVQRGFTMKMRKEDGTIETITVQAEEVQNKVEVSDYVILCYGFIIVLSQFTDDGITFSAGTYLINSGSLYVSSLQINGYNGFTTTEFVKLDPKYLSKPDWNQMDDTAADFIKNKPFGEMPTGGDTLTWKALTEDDIDLSLIVGEVFYPISDAVITIDDCAQGGELAYMDIEIGFSADKCVEFAPGVIDLWDGTFICIKEDNTTVVGGEDTITFAKAGLYANVDLAFMSFSLTLNGSTKFPSTKKIDAKYLPILEETTTTHNYGETLFWDGVIGDKVSASIGYMHAIKVTDYAPTMEELQAIEGISISTYRPRDGQVYVNTNIANTGSLSLVSLVDGAYFIAEVLDASTINPYAIICNVPGTTYGGATLPEAGTYFIYTAPNGGDLVYTHALTIPGYNFDTTTTQELVKPEYLKINWDNFEENPTVLGGSPDTVTWDGDSTGHTVFKLNDNWYYTKVSDAVLTEEDLANGGTIISKTDTGTKTTIFANSSELDIGFISAHGGYLFDDGSFKHALPESGTYFGTLMGNQIISLTVNGYKGFATEKLKEKHIPSTVPVIQSASVGEVIVVSSVDENGKPATWDTKALSWNELEDRPFGIESVTFVPEQTFTDAVDGAPLEFEFTPAIGDELTIVFDRQTYAYEVGDFFSVGVAAGNDGLLFGEAGDGGPLVMWANGQCFVQAFEKNVPHTIKVTGNKVNKIPAKYLDKTKYYYISAIDGTGCIYKDYFQQEMVTAAEYLETVQSVPILLKHDEWWTNPETGSLAVSPGDTYFPIRMEQDGKYVWIIVNGSEVKLAIAE